MEEKKDFGYKMIQKEEKNKVFSKNIKGLKKKTKKKFEKNEFEYKVILIGDASVGKSSYIKRFILDEEKKYDLKSECNIYPLNFETNLGKKMKFRVWDTSGQEKFSQNQIRDCFFENSDAVIIMFDVTSRESYKNVPSWYFELIKICIDVPFVICGNKVDSNERKVFPKNIFFHRTREIKYFEISAKSNHNLEKPFLYFANKILRKNIFFTEQPKQNPIEIIPDWEKLKWFESEFQHSIHVIPDEDDLDDQNTGELQ